MKKNDEKIIAIFDKAQNALVLQQSDLSLQSVSDMVNSGAIDISPKYQRRERWDPIKEANLIESFLLNIPVPPIYLAEDEYGTYSVIDGKQRVTAINKFLKGELLLKGLEKFIELEGCLFQDLPSSLSNALKIRPYLRVVTLLRQSDPDIKHEVFLRLNKAGVALNSQEIRNVAYRGGFNDMLFELSENSFLRNQLKATNKSKVYREMVDVQYVLRFFTMQSCWDDFPGNMDKAMDAFMAKNYRKSGNELDQFRDSFNRAIDFCEKVWGEDSFMRPGGNRRVIQGFYDIHMVCASLLKDSEVEVAIRRKRRLRNALVDELENNEEFYEAVTQFTSNPVNVEYRINRFYEILTNI